MKTETSKPSARDRLLAAADELFYEGGIHTVGIDRVIERAGVAKASLYDTFGSKDALIRAYLEARHDARKSRLTAWLERYDDPRERLLGVFDAMADLMKAKTFRGCAFTRAGAESAPTSGVRSACDEARHWMRDLFDGLARDAGIAPGIGRCARDSALHALRRRLRNGPDRRRLPRGGGRS